MSEQSKLRHLLVGLIFLGGLAIVGLATLSIKGVPWLQTELIHVRFANIDNLRDGEDVLIYGIRCGQVEELKYSPDESGGNHHIVAAISLRTKVPLTTNTEFYVRSAGPLGGRYLEIVPVDGDPVSTDYARFRGKADGDLFRQIGQFMSDHEGDLGDIVSSFSDGLASFQRIMSDVESGRGTLGRLIQDPVLAADVTGFLADVREITSTVNRGEGTLGALLKDEIMRERISSTVSNVSEIVADVRAGKGVVGMLIQDEQARKDAREFIHEARQVATEIRGGGGVMSRLLTDKELGDTVKEAIDDAHAVVHKVNSGEGTLGQALNSREAWDELIRILTLARESIEDLREQAPINTFANVLFSAF